MRVLQHCLIVVVCSLAHSSFGAPISSSLGIEGRVAAVRELPGRPELVVLLAGNAPGLQVVDVVDGARGPVFALDSGAGTEDEEDRPPAWLDVGDLDGDGVVEVVIANQHHLQVLTLAEESQELRLAARLVRPAGGVGAPLGPSAEHFAVASLGSIRSLSLDREGETLEFEQLVAVPLRASRRSRGFRLTSPPVVRLDGSRFALGPEASGARRLMTSLVDATEMLEFWSLLPAPETVEQSWYVLFDQRPALVVATVSSEKFGVFAKYKLRVFPLVSGRSRSRSGRPASLKVDTVTRRWYQLDVRSLDATLDGNDDLVVLQPEGLGAGKLFVDLYPGRGNLGFGATPRRTKLGYGEADYLYGPDVDRDGVADFLVLDDSELIIHRGLAEHPKLVVEKRSNWSVALDRPVEEGGIRVEIEIGSPPEDLDDLEWYRHDVEPLRRLTTGPEVVRLLVVLTDGQETVLQVIDFAGE